MDREEAERRLTAPGAEFEIDGIDVRGARTRVWRNAPTSLVEVLRASRRHGDRTFLVLDDTRMTFEEHFRAAAHLAHTLRDRFGVRPGDRVAIAMRNLPEWSVAFWAAAAAGAIVVPLNAWWSGYELAFGLADSGATVLICDGEREQRLAGHRSSLDRLGTVVVARGGDGDHVRLEDLITGAPAEIDLPDVRVGPDDDATILYTSGTTGRPKGALGTHRNICTNTMSLAFVAARARLLAGGSGAPAGKVVLLSVPLFHATGCHSILVPQTFAGGTLVMMRRWDAGHALELVERERVSTISGVPTMALQLLDHPDIATRDVSSLRGIGYGGAPAPPDLAGRIGDRLPGRALSQSYGLTETSSLSTTIQGDDYRAHPTSVGLPVPVVDVKVVDDAGRTLPAGEVGELWITGPNVVKGYWRRPDATSASFTDGWLHTGDIGRIDDDGFVYVVDRAKDVLSRGGENVYCVEIETVLQGHPAVADAAVIGVPHPVLGEEVGAVVQVRPGHHVDPAELQRHVRERLAEFKVPVHVWLTAQELPRNPAGKILKRQLRERVLAHPAE